MLVFRARKLPIKPIALIVKVKGISTIRKISHALCVLKQPLLFNASYAPAIVSSIKQLALIAAILPTLTIARNATTITSIPTHQSVWIAMQPSSLH
jgi:hypothetical protein